MKINNLPTPRFPLIETAGNKPQTKTQSQEPGIAKSAVARNETSDLKMEQKAVGDLRRKNLETQLQSEPASDISTIDLKPIGIFSFDSAQTVAQKDPIQTSKVEYYAEKFDIQDTNEDED